MRLATLDTGKIGYQNGNFLFDGKRGESFGSDVPVIGFNLGFDFCAEHEWGFDGIKRALFMPIKKEYDSFDDVIVPADNKKIQLIRSGNYTAIALNLTYRVEDTAKAVVNQVKNSYTKEGFLAGWSKDDLMLIGFGENAKFVTNLYEQMVAGNIAIMQASGFLGRGGLSLLFVDAYPAKQEFNDACDDRKKLLKAAEDTGIEARITEKLGGTGVFHTPFYALSPRWADSKKKTKYPVIFWLNPTGQSTNNHGWFTVEELDQWTEGKGPVIKSKEKA